MKRNWIYSFVALLVTGILLLSACAPKLSPMMSDEDMQTCDDSVAALKLSMSSSFGPSSNAKYYLVTPGEAEISTPGTGSILPLGPVAIKFKQPPADAGVSYRNLTVLVTSLTGSNMVWVGSSYSVVPQAQTDLEVTWTPTKPGSYILMVLFRNLETISVLGDNTALMAEQLELKAMGNHQEDFNIHFGPFSLAYVCVKVEATVNQSQPDGPVVLMPPDNLTLVPSSTIMTIPSTTRTFTSTPLATLTWTLTRTPVRLVVTNTFTPPPPVVDCSAYQSPDTCAPNPACEWGHLPSGAEACVNR